jgi:hypothetical protein
MRLASFTLQHNNIHFNSSVGRVEALDHFDRGSGVTGQRQ